MCATEQGRSPTLLIEDRLGLRRRVARCQRHVNREEVRPVPSRVEQGPRHLVRGLDLGGHRLVREIVDLDEDVVRARRGHRLEHRAVRGRRVGGAPRVERVRDEAHRGELFEDPFARGIGDRWDVQADGRREVGDERRLPGADRHDPGPPAPDATTRPADALDELRRLEQLVEVGAADDAGGIEGGVGRARLARQRAGVGDRRGLRLLAAADLDDHDRLAELERPIGERQEPLGPPEALEEEDHRRGLRVVEAVREVVADVEDDLRSAADDPAEADPRARLDERVGDRARLGDAGDPATWQVGRHVADVGGLVHGQIDDAHAIRADQGETVAPRDRRHLGLHRGGRRSALDHAAARDDDRGDAGVGGGLGHVGGPQRVEGDERDVGLLRKGIERRVARLTEELVVLRVDEMAAGRAAHLSRRLSRTVPAIQLRADAPTIAIDSGRKTGVRSIVRPASVGLRIVALGVRGHPTTRSTPRFSSARAMISRWISDVPSQIRSTRSSRKNRSAAVSRM